MNNQSKPHFLIGLIGNGIQASLTPAMHEQEGEMQGLAYFYQRIDLQLLGLGAEALPELLQSAKRMGFKGLNITHPCKQRVVELLDELSEEARMIGAVNTVRIADGKLMGHNTDGPAFVRSFREQLADLRHDSIVLLGAGGAGNAIAHSMLRSVGTRLTVFDADQEQAGDLVERLQREYGSQRACFSADLASALASADGVINATPMGMKGNPGSAIPASLLRSSLWVADIVYFPIETELLRLARAAGCRVMDGGGMAVYQAVGAFEIFTGIKPDAARMLQHFLDLLATQYPTVTRAAAGGEGRRAQS